MKSLTIFCLVVLICSLAFPQDGTLDTGFGAGGIVITPDGYASCIKIQSDGKIIIGGTDINDTFTAVRYNNTGTLDYTYGNFGIVKTFLSINGSRMQASALFPGNKIIQAGIANLYIDNKISVLVRYDSIGNRDYTFGNNGVVFHDVISGSEYISKVIVQPDEKILVSGYTLSNGFVFRCNSNGEIDSTFGINGHIFTTAFIYVYSMMLQHDGKIVITGNSLTVPPSKIVVARFNYDGSPDSSFGSGGFVFTSTDSGTPGVNSLALQPDGKIVIAGQRLGMVGETLEYVFIRYNRNGSLDNNFGIRGIVRLIPYGDFNYLVNLALQSDGKILISGGAVVDTIGSGKSGMFLMRFDQNGNVDTSFGDNGFFITPTGLGLSTGREFEIQEDNKIVLIGNSNGNFATIRVNATSISSIKEFPNLELPEEFILEQNYPNPFNPSTSIQYTISVKQFVQLKVYDILGGEVVTLVNEEQPAGIYEVEFSTTGGPASSIKNLASGIYFYKLTAGDFVQTRKMVLLK